MMAWPSEPLCLALNWPIVRFSRTVMARKMRLPSGTSAKPCDARWCAGSRVTSFPDSLMVPARIGSRPATALRNVDLPAPLRPTKAVTRPGFACSDMSHTAIMSP